LGNLLKDEEIYFFNSGPESGRSFFHNLLDNFFCNCDIINVMIIPPNIIRIVVTVGIIALIILAITYLFEFLRPIIIGLVLLVIAWFLYRYFIVGTTRFW
jgi:hypothetical protein